MGKKNRKKGRDRDEPTPAPVADSKSPKLTKTGRPVWLLPLLALLAIGGAVAIVLATGGGDDITLDWEVVTVFKHESTGTYTQGLEFYKGFLFEGTGYQEESDWRIVNLQTGEVCYRHGISSNLFGEGITILGDTLYQLTYRDGLAMRYDLSGLKLDEKDPMAITAESFEGLRAVEKPSQSKRFKYTGEGWGLTNDGTHLIMSSGNKNGEIVYRDKDTFKVVKTIVVKDAEGVPVEGLNELEYHDGHIWANIYTKDFVVKIDAETGEVVDKADMTGLLKDTSMLKPGEVLNGIARDPASGKMYLTGKNWPKLFDVKFTKREE